MLITVDNRVDVHAREEARGDLVAVLLAHHVHEEAFGRQLGQLPVLFAPAEPSVFGLGGEGHDRDGHVLLAGESFTVFHTELADAVDIVAEKADDPFEWAIVHPIVDLLLKVRHLGVLPLIRKL